MKLLIGTGRQKTGYTTIDIDPDLKPNIVGDATTEMRKLKSNTIERIESYHFIEHLTYKEGQDYIMQCSRLLRKGGVLVTEFPDLEMLALKIIQGETRVVRAIYGDQERKYYAHKSGYTTKMIENILKKNNFKIIKILGSKTNMRYGVTVYAEKE